MGINETIVPDVYIDGVLSVEILGGGNNVRVTYFTWQRGERIAVAQLVMPVSVISQSDIIRLLAKQLRLAEGASEANEAALH